MLVTGGLKCAGSSANGQLGQQGTIDWGDDPTRAGASLPVVAVGSSRTVLRVSSGRQHTAVVLDTGEVKVFGLGASGQLGLGSTVSRGHALNTMGDALGQAVTSTEFRALEVYAGGDATCVLHSNRRLKCFGRGGVLGLGDSQARGDHPNEMNTNLPFVTLSAEATSDPPSVLLREKPENVTSICTGEHHTCMLLSNGLVKCFGGNGHGQVSRFVARFSSSPRPVANVCVWTALIQNRSLASTQPRAAASRMVTWATGCPTWSSSPERRRFGLSADVSPLPKISPCARLALNFVRFAPPIKSITCSDTLRSKNAEHHTCALLETGRLKCWGLNNFGQLGYGDTTNRGSTTQSMGNNLPYVNLGSVSSVKDFSLYRGHTCAVLTGGAAEGNVKV